MEPSTDVIRVALDIAGAYIAALGKTTQSEDIDRILAYIARARIELARLDSALISRAG